MDAVAKTSPLRVVTNRLLDDDLDELLRALRSEGLSWDAIAAEIYSRSHVNVTAVTVAAWGATLGLDTGRFVS